MDRVDVSLQQPTFHKLGVTLLTFEGFDPDVSHPNMTGHVTLGGIQSTTAVTLITGGKSI